MSSLPKSLWLRMMLALTLGLTCVNCESESGARDPRASVVLVPGGLGNLRFGAAQRAVELFMASKLGQPSYRSETVGNVCEPYDAPRSMVVWQDVAVEFTTAGGGEPAFRGWRYSSDILDYSSGKVVPVTQTAMVATAGSNRLGSPAVAFFEEFGASASFRSADPSRPPGPGIWVLGADPAEPMIVGLDADNDTTARAVSLVSGTVGCAD